MARKQLGSPDEQIDFESMSDRVEEYKIFRLLVDDIVLGSLGDPDSVHFTYRASLKLKNNSPKH